MSEGHAEIWLEIGLLVTASRQPAEPDVGIMSAYWEDLNVEAAFHETTTLSWGADRTAPAKRTTKRVDLMEGVDPKSADVHRLLFNILQAYGEQDAAQAIAAEMAD